MKRYRVTVDGRDYDVEVDDPRAHPVTARLDGVVYSVDVHLPRPAAEQDRSSAEEAMPPTVRTSESAAAEGAVAPAAAASEPEGVAAEPGAAPAAAAAEASEVAPQTMTAPIPGVVASVVANVGQVVKRGDELLTLEAMKMFNVLRSPWAGTVTTLHVSKGEHVNQGQPLVTFGRR
ncbi:MAG: acetyl-CoA carboxylase biotin carboxyl carrier protein subunit [Acidobacteria bacterium]|nr:acetyl-CoA carboxylase biotin carboxyl carrier protein subunit [Acidobacteriota bacterium]